MWKFPVGLSRIFAFRKESLLFPSVWIAGLKVSQSHRWVLTFCAQSSFPSSLSASQSALPQSGSVDIWRRAAREPACGDKVSAVVIIGFLSWPSTCSGVAVFLRTGWSGVSIQASWVTTIHTDGGEWWSVSTWSTSMTNLLSDRLIPLTKHWIKSP